MPSDIDHCDVVCCRDAEQASQLLSEAGASLHVARSDDKIRVFEGSDHLGNYVWVVGKISIHVPNDVGL